MFKNFNWGHGIALFYVLFVGVLLTALISSFGVDHSLVVDDYYKKDLNYQQQFEQMENAMDSNNAYIKEDKKNNAITIGFLNDSVSEASAQFYRPSDASKDFEINLENKVNTLSTKSMIPGKWIVKMTWKEGSKKFYLEQDIRI